MIKQTDIKLYEEFDDYYKDTIGDVRSKNLDFHIFRFNELGKKLVNKHGPFRVAYFQFALGVSLNANVSIYNKTFISEEYSMVIYTPGQIIEWERTGPWDGYVINVKESFLNNILIEQQLANYLFLQDISPLVFKMNSDDYQGLRNIYEMILNEHKKLDNENVFVIKKLLNILLIYTNRIIKSSNETHLKESAFSYIKNREIANHFKSLVLKKYLESKTVAFYAKELMVTSDTLNKEVKRVFNQSPKDFINEVILLHAQTMLKRPNSSIKEVCYDLNFDDYSHFVKFFKKLTGLSPAEYKNQFS